MIRFILNLLSRLVNLVTKRSIRLHEGAAKKRKLIKSDDLNQNNLSSFPHLTQEMIAQVQRAMDVQERSRTKEFQAVMVVGAHFFEFLNSPSYEIAKAAHNFVISENIFSYYMVMIPIHLENHWCLAVINVIDRSILVYDSLPNAHATTLELITQFVIEQSIKRNCHFLIIFLENRSCQKCT